MERREVESGKACGGGRREKEVEAGVGVEELWNKNGVWTKKKGMARCLVCGECGDGGREGKWWTAVIGVRDGGEASDGWKEEWLKAEGVWRSRTLED